MLSNVKIDSKSIVHLSLSVEYQSDLGRHKDIYHFEKFNVWRDADLLPSDMQQQLMGKEAGYKQSFNFKAGELTDKKLSSLLYTIKNQQFNRHPRENLKIEPEAGRYYPKGWFQGINDNYSENMFPARLVHIDDDKIEVDFNHPLADYNLVLGIEVFSVHQSFDEHGGRCSDALSVLLDGPGMQLPYKHKVTEFINNESFSRVDSNADGLFYVMPRKVNHIDSQAQQNLSNLYDDLLPREGRILDLMSSINSHLSEKFNHAQVTGLGMNQEELDLNPRLSETLIHDLNTDTQLPYDNETFDAVMCNLSVEYLTQPINVFVEVARVLKKGGVFVCSFSNRWFPTKAIAIWNNLHEFERVALVAEYFTASKCFEDMHTYSLRGQSRPDDDAHINKSFVSDPIYAVWGKKK